MTTSLQTFSEQSRERIEAALRTQLPTPDTQQPRLAEAMTYSLLNNGGKRIRPILVYASAAALGRAADDQLDAVAVALECIHAYSLIHDDLPAMDDDDLRRGQPSCHIAFDEATAILAGDALQTLAFETLANSGLSAEQRIDLVQTLAEASGARGMVLGQAIDLGAVKRELTLEDLERMHRHKTGALISASVVMAAQACRASEAQCKALARFSLAVGLAFQVQDDILDVTADTAVLGKRQGADTARQKPTYVSLLGLEGARAKSRELLALALESLSIFGPPADPLRELARYIVERDH